MPSKCTVHQIVKIKYDSINYIYVILCIIHVIILKFKTKVTMYILCKYS